jgi:hypothetical protein
MSEGYPVPYVNWKKNKRMLRGQNRHLRVFGGQLRIYGANSHDVGIYICDSRNKAGFASESIWLDMLEPPVINTRKNYTLIEENKSLTLDCAASGHPTPEIIWEFNGTALDTTGSKV